MPKINLEEPVPVSELLELALEHPDACYDPERHIPKPELVKVYTAKLQEKADLYEDYFSICFSKGSVIDPNAMEIDNPEQPTRTLMLEALPMVVPAIRPFAQELPMFLLRLATEVDSQSEESKFID